MQQLAWLHAVPDAPLRAQTIAKSKLPDQEKRSRAQDREEAGLSINLPPIAAGSHLVAYLWEFGPTVPAGMGEGAVTFAEMRAWQQLVGVDLSAWEARTLRAMSRAFAGQSQRSTKPDCPSPWAPNPATLDRAQIARNVRNALHS